MAAQVGQADLDQAANPRKIAPGSIGHQKEGDTLGADTPPNGRQEASGSRCRTDLQQMTSVHTRKTVFEVDGVVGSSSAHPIAEHPKHPNRP
jgi:hypothetical protein